MAKKTAGKGHITLEEVRDACIALLKQGRRVGPWNVRLELGGRGSYTTINKHLNALGFSSHASKTRQEDD